MPGDLTFLIGPVPRRAAPANRLYARNPRLGRCPPMAGYVSASPLTPSASCATSTSSTGASNEGDPVALKQQIGNVETSKSRLRPVSPPTAGTIVSFNQALFARPVGDQHRRLRRRLAVRT